MKSQKVGLTTVPTSCTPVVARKGTLVDIPKVLNNILCGAVNEFVTQGSDSYLDSYLGIVTAICAIGWVSDGRVSRNRVVKMVLMIGRTV